MSKPVSRENPFVSLAFNIVLPVIVLQQLSPHFGEKGPLIALLAALALPVCYGIWEYLTRRHKSYVSLLGVINVVFTGGFALLRLDGIWFAVKEAAFPLVLGIGVGLSAFSKRPFLRMLILNEQVIKMDRLEQSLRERNTEAAFTHLVRTGTLLLTFSFLFSAAVNFILARRIFTDLDPSLTENAQAEMLNTQIAKMTGYGYVAIALPMMVFMLGVLVWFFRRMYRLTGLRFEELIKG